MNDLEAFETQLRQMKPARPSDELMARLEGNAVPEPTRGGFDFWMLARFLLAGAGAAAALVAVAWLVSGNKGMVHVSVASAVARPTATASPAPLVCASATEAAIAARDEGIYTVGDGQPVEVMRLLDLNKSVWKDPRSGSRMEIVLPHQVLLVKNVETY